MGLYQGTSDLSRATIIDQRYYGLMVSLHEKHPQQS